MKAEVKASKIEINELPRYSPWPSRLFGLSDWDIKHRNNVIVSHEYGEKWGRLLSKYQERKFTNINEVLHYLFDTHFSDNILFHIYENIYYSANTPVFWDFFYNQIIQAITRYLTPNDTLVEMGCGWGRNLFTLYQRKLFKNAIGGEFTQEGITLGNLIAKEFNVPLEFFHFDYYNPKQEFMEKINGTVVFSHNSIEQITQMPQKTILSLIENRPKIVFHFEPIYEYRNKDTLLHYMWKRYTQVNEYNINLLTLLKDFEKKGQIRIDLEVPHVLGLNAFNPGSFIVWQPI
ncbi:hypothetical protein KSMBR1_1970 [Candidatus Kuenenia stuttgartiensis]|uniref:Class I SAM-dependent methyltransferase n=2 Tax=Kuenenia stuttgartiensis TaxID=174633 RepID=A0A2C9CFU5_KUEST|nr:hypothetical protein KSMBR1_1970 [Candidatus Kuenenia stuttgartiensis]